MEIQLAEKLGVSRTPIREAIRKLELEGLVLMIPRKGAEVAKISEKSLRDVLEVRRILDEHNSKMMIVAKIENMQGIKNLDEIIDVSDGIMAARGDMGVEVPLEEVPVLQKQIIKKAVAKGKQVITATQDAGVHDS